MQAEPLGGATYKITLDKTEAQRIPIDGTPRAMHRFICEIIEQLSSEQGVTLPDGRLLVEAFLRSDGSCVFFISPLESTRLCHSDRIYACELTGLELLRHLCAALSSADVQCSIYCGTEPDSYRIIFADPAPDIQRICTEYGTYCEITPLFAAQTAEYLTEIATGNAAALLYEILG